MKKSSKSGKKTDDSKLLRKRAKDRLVSEAKCEIPTLAMGSVAMVVSMYCNQAVPVMMGKLTDLSSFKEKNSTGSSNNHQAAISSFLWLAAVGGTASFARTLLLNRTQQRIESRLRMDAFETLLMKRDLEWFQIEDTASITETLEEEEEDARGEGNKDKKSNDEEKEEVSSSKDKSETSATTTGMTPAAICVIVKEDVETVAKTITATMPNLIRSCSSCFFSAYRMLTINPSLVGLSLGVAPIVGTVVWMTRKYIKKIVSVQQKAALDAASFLEERLNHIAIVKMSNRETTEVDTYQKMEETQINLGNRSALANGISMGIMFSLGTTALCGILFAGGKAVEKGRMSHGQLVTFGSNSAMLALGTGGVISALNQYMTNMVSAIRLHRLIESNHEKNKTKYDVSQKFAIDFSSFKVRSLTFDNVSFYYMSDSNATILKNVSLELSRGEVVALLGKNGSGKTTIASLLGGLYKPTSGQISIRYVVEEEKKEDTTTTESNNKIDETGVIDYSNQLDRRSQSKLLQVIPQSPALFNTTILENIRYSCPDASEEDIMEAMKTANCNGFVSKLEGGLSYQVGRNGSRLSAGQRQRLALARALLSDPTFLVMDEPASALDAEGETAVADAMMEMCRSSSSSKQRGLLVVTHRAKSLELVDRIVVLHDGEIVESGTFPELTRNKESELCKLMPELI